MLSLPLLVPGIHPHSQALWHPFPSIFVLGTPTLCCVMVHLPGGLPFFLASLLLCLLSALSCKSATNHAAPVRAVVL